MTTANKITLTRIAMIPFFIYFAAQPMRIIDELRYHVVFPTSTVIALVLFCVASFTDFLDGYVARKYNQVTDFGKFVDPLADKLLVASALILFVEQKAMAGWMVCIILARELIITSLRVVAANKGVVMAATWTGKVKTCVQIGGIIGPARGRGGGVLPVQRPAAAGVASSARRGLSVAICPARRGAAVLSYIAM